MNVIDMQDNAYFDGGAATAGDTPKPIAMKDA